ncbi:hypothetical protein PCO31110_01593 [Pandoraea communis]|uniref:Dit-like phage tail protein N-terminal domain-containing protein n=1 Tax=Pandoraea communis TaxID=2508297 RepID=A0A5E4TTG5_9BURK|nr:hypothetical protein [Pandoraea communis]VVD90492.1 hypothetical protein PCO31110_01593 [Pandoraea communis]
MALDFISVPKFPSIPALPGVPPLARGAAVSVVSAINDGPLNIVSGLGLSALSSILSSLFGPGASSLVYGVFSSDGTSFLEPDSILAFDYTNESRLPDYPVEQGSFETYNKVDTPYITHLRMVKGGSSYERAQFLLQLEYLRKSTELVTVLTPERPYVNANVVAYRYGRDSRQGVALVIADVAIQEVRQAPAAQFTSTEEPASEDTFSLGQVQSQAVSAANSVLFGPVSTVLGANGLPNVRGLL